MYKRQSFGRSLEKSSVIFTSELSLENDILKNNDTKKEFVAVKNTRNISK